MKRDIPVPKNTIKPTTAEAKAALEALRGIPTREPSSVAISLDNEIVLKPGKVSEALKELPPHVASLVARCLLHWLHRQQDIIPNWENAVLELTQGVYWLFGAIDGPPPINGSGILIRANSEIAVASPSGKPEQVLFVAGKEDRHSLKELLSVYIL